MFLISKGCFLRLLILVIVIYVISNCRRGLILYNSWKYVNIDRYLNNKGNEYFEDINDNRNFSCISSSREFSSLKNR